MWVLAAHSSRSGIGRSLFVPFFRSRIDHKMFLRNKLIYLTYTVIFAVNIFQIVAILALAVVAAKGVHTLPVVWAEVLPSYTFINI